LFGHAVIAGENQNLNAIEPRRVTLPVCQPRNEILEPAEASRRLGQGRFALHHGGARGRMSARQVETGGTQR
jgi:hypothetical protein